MAKLNTPMRSNRREIRARADERKREIHGDPKSKKLKIKHLPLAVTGKRKRKLFNRIWKEQKQALLQGLEQTEKEMEMVPVNDPQGTSEGDKKNSLQVYIKKALKMKVNKRRGKGAASTTMDSSESVVDAMEE